MGGQILRLPAAAAAAAIAAAAAAAAVAAVAAGICLMLDAGGEDGVGYTKGLDRIQKLWDLQAPPATIYQPLCCSNKQQNKRRQQNFVSNL